MSQKTAPSAADTLYIAVGRMIAAQRKELGLTQAQLASAVSLSRTSITNIEQGNQKVLLHTLYAIAAALGTSLASLLPAHGQAPPPAPMEVELPPDLSDPEKKWICKMVSKPRRTS